MGLLGPTGGIGGGEVELHHVLHRIHPRVGHRHVHRDLGLRGQSGGVSILASPTHPLELGVREAVAKKKGVVHRRVVPGVPVGEAPGLIGTIADDTPSSYSTPKTPFSKLFL